MSYDAGNIRVFGQPTSSQILWISPEVGTKWALDVLLNSRLKQAFKPVRRGNRMKAP